MADGCVLLLPILENFFQFQRHPIVKENLQCTNADSGNFVFAFQT
jgi:hypothetical protein